MQKQLFLVATTISLLYASNNSFYQDARRGWHYYEIEPKQEVEKQEQKKKDLDNDREFMRSIPIDALDTLSVKEYNAMFERVKSIATMHPTKENVKIMQIMNKWQTEQSERFAKVWAINLLEDPNLEYPEIAENRFAKLSKNLTKKKEIEDFFGPKKDRLGFVVFYGNLNPKGLDRQKEVYKHIENLYGIKAEFINVDDKPSLKTRFKLTTSPENFFVYKNDKDEALWHRIKAGYATQDDIINNTRFLFDNAIIEKDK